MYMLPCHTPSYSQLTTPIRLSPPPQQDSLSQRPSDCVSSILPYPRERGPMGGAPYIGPRLGDGPIFEVSVSHLVTKERPGKLPTLSS